MKVAVLLATHNGLSWLPTQVASILEQQDVEIQLFVSDDQSCDGSVAWLQDYASRDVRVALLPPTGPYGSAAANFYRLLREANFSTANYVAFADQDDLWFPDKLARAVARLEQTGAAAVSSNVLAYWPNGHQQLVDKAQPQQAFDFLFEAAGPGCTYVMTPALARMVRGVLAQISAGTAPAHHDWLCYALCRALGDRWFIDPEPSMAYRQHGSNEVGVNRGMKAARGRHRKIVSGWYRREVLGMAYLTRALRPEDTELAKLVRRLERGSVADRFILACRVSEFRRRWRDRLILAAYFISGLFWRRQM